jgi:hypothetical protein
MKDRDSMLRLVGMASVMIVLACLLLALGIATGIALSERTREPASETARDD